MIVLTDERVKEEICFGETLIISCGHYEGDLHDDDVDDDNDEEKSESEWTCTESPDLTVSEEDKVQLPYEVKDYIVEESVHEEEEEEVDEFSFYFFPDCNKPPPPQNSKSSLIVANGLPKLNPTAKGQKICTCVKDKAGECPCYTKVPCKCGAKTIADCICSELKDICICDAGYPRTVCTCKNVNVCVCDPDGKIFTKCTCAKIEKPCICHPGKFPNPICKCKHKPTFSSLIQTKRDEVIGEGYKDTFPNSRESKGEEPCVCQKPEPKKLCYCLKGKDCTCLTECICGVQRPCLCEPEQSDDINEEIPCKYDKNKSICSCDIPKVCSCENENAGAVCKCFPVQVCTCGDPANCKCFTTCDCTNPCICDTLPAKTEECICLKPPGASDYASTCQCIRESTKKQKKVRAGKDGYRWCHEVDAHHTYFDYAYGKNDLINHEEPKVEKFQIKGLHDKSDEVDSCPVHGPWVPQFKKKARKPSLDCCSSVGGRYI